jgi:four helix bundle protein
VLGGAGTVDALAPGMVAKHFKELVCWQLSIELHAKLDAILSTPEAARHFKLCDQMRAASVSVSSNIAEGFKRFSPPDFAKFLGYSRGSLAELSSQLEIMKRLGIGRATDHSDLSLLIARCSMGVSETLCVRRR